MIGESRNFEKPIFKWLGTVSVLAVGFGLLLLVTYPSLILGDNSQWSRHIHQGYPFHSAVETIIGITAILLGFSIWSRKKDSGKKFLTPIPLGLWPMGMLALFHSFISAPNEFIFLYSASLLTGAIGFSLCWFNRDIRIKFNPVRTPWIVLLTSLVFAVAVVATSSFGISMSENGSFSNPAIVINLAAGLLFAVAALKLFNEALSSKKDWLLYLVATIAMTGAVAGLTFPFSQAWSHGWWTHHFLRLAAFLATLIVLQRINNQAEKEKERALSEKAELAEELKIKQERLSLALEAARDGIWDWDLESNQLYYSPAWSGMLGYEENELLGSLEIWESLVHPEDIDEAKQVIESYMSGKIPSYSLEFRMRHKDGHYLNILSRGKLIKRDSDQKPVRFIGTHSDLTEIRKAETELLLYKRLVEKSSHGCGLGTLDGKVTYMNPSLMRLLGIDSLEDVVGTDLASYYPENLRNKIHKEILPRIMEEGSWEGESRLKSADGTTLPTLENFFLIRDSKNQPLCLADVIVDISPIKEALATLEESESRLKEFFDMTDNLVSQVDRNGNFLFINQEAGRIYGIPPDQCLGRSAFDFIHPDDAARTQESFQEWIAERKSQVSFENRQVLNDGNSVDMLWSINPKYDEEGNVVHIWSVARDISEIKAYQRKLQEANELIDEEKEFSETVINSLPGVFYLFDESLKFQLWNKNFENITGYNPEELASLSPLELFDKNEAELVAGRIGETFTKGSSSVEADFISRDGTRTPYYFTGLHIAIKGANYLLGVGVDISKRKKAELEREQVLGSLKERIKEQQCLFRVSEAVKSSNSMDILFEKIIDAVQEGWQYPEITRCRILFDDRINTKIPFEPTEYKLISEIVCRNEQRGSIEIYYMEKRPEMDEGPFMKEERIVLDQVALRIGEAASIYQSNRDRLARQGIGEGFLEADEEIAYKTALQKILETMESRHGMLGYIDEEGAMVYPSITREIWKKCSTEYKEIRFPLDTWGGLWGRSLAEKKILFSNRELPVPKGHIPIKNTITAPILLKDQLVGHINIANKESGYTRNDVTLLENLATYLAPIIEARRQQKFAGIALQNERYQLKTLFNSTDDIIYVADPEKYELLYVNGAFRKIWGEDVIGKKCYKALQNRDDPCPFCTNDKIFGEHLGKTYIWEFQNEITQQWFRCADKAITWSDGRSVRLEIATDITESKLFTQGQIRTEKLSALGLVAAGVAHELNNPLMGVLNYAQYCLHKTEKDDKRYPVLMDIEQETKRCAGIVESLLSASRMDDLTSGTIMNFNPERVINDVVRLLEYRASKEKVRVSKKAGENISEVKMSRDAFQQLFLNLYTNAIDSVESSKKKNISIEILENSTQLILKITDTGCGIPHELREKIFDPFYTTKAPGKGTGLGLATCWKIVHSQGGHIDCRSRPGVGTTMTIYLPKMVAEGRYQM